MKKAFTLIEVMAALAIISVSLIVLIRGQTQSLNNVQRVQGYEKALFVTENNLHWTFLDLNEAANWEDLRDLTVEDGAYRCRITIEPVEMENDLGVSLVMLRIRAVTYWYEGERESQMALETMYLWGQQQ